MTNQTIEAKQLNDLLVEHVMALEDKGTQLRARIEALEAALQDILNCACNCQDTNRIARAALAEGQDK